MESIIYEKDYYEDHQKELEKDTKSVDIFDGLKDSGFFDFYGAVSRILPQVVVEQDKENYERLLNACDDYAKRYGGKIYGIVDYENFQSQIKLTMRSFIEFGEPGELALLADIAQSGQNVCFEIKEDGSLELSILINYFEDAPLDLEDIAAMRELVGKASQESGVNLVEALEQWRTLLDVDLLEEVNDVEESK